MSQTEHGTPSKMDYLHTIDLVVLRYCRKTQALQVLLHKRPGEPYAESWALPGLVLNGDVRDVSMDDGMKRLIASEKIGIEPGYIEQVGTVGNAFRDPRCWSSSTFYIAIVDREAHLNERQKFVPLQALLSRDNLLPFDHNELVEQAAERLYSKSLYSSLPLLFLGNEFSAPEATTIYSVALGRPVLKSSMRQRLIKLTEEGFIKETGRKKSGEGIKAQATVENLRPGRIFYFDRSFA
ncbi:NUDIX hydrolase [Pseudomonas floridensis]|uniref:NUDIX hydrolase n=1 Tax=Pseudomonas floridensis TaxID=1958950 RepID=A0A1X0N679_9PSED|nr:NUDIX hydrolase [Pseudomonas floridensis]ORC58440.1 NUDIX hydrolase [Pseudomonas floridensis]